MEQIASFQIDHIKLQPGLYVSRVDRFNDTDITTFDIRMKSPNEEPCMNTAELHTMEHIIATYVRNDAEWKDRIVYFGPMGCRTGNYLVVAGKWTSRDLLPLMIGAFEFLRDFEGVVPATVPKECGNYLDHNLDMAKYEAKKYLDVLYNITDDRLVYPE